MTQESSSIGHLQRLAPREPLRPMVLKAGAGQERGEGPSPRPRGAPGWLKTLHPGVGVRVGGEGPAAGEKWRVGAVWGQREVCRKQEARAGLDLET